MRYGLWILAAVGLVACGGDDSVTNDDAGADSSTNDGATANDGSPKTDAAGTDAAIDAPSNVDGSTPLGTPAVIGGCKMLPANHVFNTPIASLPVHPNSAAFIATIGSANLHLDLGSTVNQSSPTYYGIPFNLVKGNTIPWSPISYYSADSTLDWDPKPESDCGSGSAHAKVAPCTTANAPAPLLPIPAAPLVEGGIDTDPQMPYGDHHILMLDTDKCWLWESYHSYPKSTGGWNVFGSAVFDLSSNALRPSTWSSADAAGFPILPLLLRADEAATGKITHALRFTMTSGNIRAEFTWPARHKTGNNTSQNAPPMGQLFRLKASYAIPAGFTVQAKAILQAMKDYGMYVADGGSNWYVTGDPSAAWSSQTISNVQTVSGTNFEAVDLAPIRNRAGFDPNSGAVPP